MHRLIARRHPPVALFRAALIVVGLVSGTRASTAAEEAYSLVEVLALQRDNQAADRPLVSDATSGATLLSVSDLDASTALGARVFVGRRVDDSWGREAGDPFPVSIPALMRELGNSPRGVSEGGA